MKTNLPHSPFTTRLSGSAKATERRIRSIFQGPKKRPPIWLMALTAAAILSCGGLVSCRPEAENPPDTSQTPEDVSAPLENVTLFDAGGMTIAFPNDIYDQLVIFPGEDADTLVSVYEKASYEALQADYGEDARGGFLFEITRNSQAQYESFLMFDIPGQDYFAQDGAGYYCWNTPTDMQLYRNGGALTDEDIEEWEQIRLQVEDIRDDFTQRNGLTPFDGSEIFSREFIYEGEHLYASYSNWSTSMILTLSQPVKQGEGGIWCVERWQDEYNSYLSFYMEGFPQSEGITAAEHYQQLQNAADAGQRPELLDPRQAAVVWLQNYYRDTDSIAVTLDDVTLLEEETLSPAERAQKFLTEADSVYSSVTIELYGETVPVLVRALDGDGSNSIGLDHTISLEMLKNVDLSEYREIESLEDAGIPSDMPFADFYAGIGEERCQITVVPEPTMTNMAIRFQFDDGEEYFVAGPMSQDLIQAASRAEGVWQFTYETDGSIWNTKDGSRGLLIRGFGMIVLTAFDLTMEHTEPIQDPGDTVFDCLLEVIGSGKTYHYDSEHLRFQEDGSEDIYEIQCDDNFASVMRSALRTIPSRTNSSD